MTSNQESQLESLLLVQARVAVSRVVQAQIIFPKTLAAAKTLSDCVTGKLKVHTAKEGSQLLVDFEGRSNFRENGREVTGLDARLGRTRVAAFVVSSGNAPDISELTHA